jgi:hypothetical protein
MGILVGLRLKNKLPVIAHCEILLSPLRQISGVSMTGSSIGAVICYGIDVAYLCAFSFYILRSIGIAKVPVDLRPAAQQSLDNLGKLILNKAIIAIITGTAVSPNLPQIASLVQASKNVPTLHH